MELWTGALSYWKCYWPDLKSASLFPVNLLLNSLNIVFLVNCLSSGKPTLVFWLPYPSHTSHHPSQPSSLPWISYATQKLMLDSFKMVEKQSEAFHTFLWCFPSLKQNFIAYRSSKVSSRQDCIFEIHQLWQSGFSRVYSNCCCSCSFEPEIIKIGQSSLKLYSNKIVNFQESSTGNLLKAPRIKLNMVICFCVFCCGVYNVKCTLSIGKGI